MSLIKSNNDIANIKIAGAKLSAILKSAGEMAQPGTSLLSIDQHVAELMQKEGVTASFLGHEGFPASACLSLNSQVVHGIPDGRTLKGGDILGIDAGLWYNQVCVDAAITVPIGRVDPKVKKLLEVTEKALIDGIKAAKPFRRVGSISNAIQKYAEANDFGIVRALVGHGVGHHVHEAPDVPNMGPTSYGALLRPGMVLAIEPMFTLGGGEILTETDGWSVITADGSYAAHFEHTVIITAKGPFIATK